MNILEGGHFPLLFVFPFYLSITFMHFLILTCLSILAQLVSNGKFVSSKHRVVASSIGPRISVAFFFSGPIEGNKIYGPIEELVSTEYPAVYKEVLLRDYAMRFMSTGLDDKKTGIDFYRL